MMTVLGVSCAENEIEPRIVVQHRISRERRSTSSSEPVRQVVAAWIVAVFVLVAGLSVLAFPERGTRDDGVAAVAVHWHQPPVASDEESDEGLCCSPIRTCRGGLLTQCDCADWTTTQSQGDSASMCSSGDCRGAQEPSDYCRGRSPFHRSPDFANKGHMGSVIRVRGV
jgi:hypothetical protein